MTKKTFFVQVEILKDAVLTVEANNKKEAREKAREFDCIEEETQSERVRKVFSVREVV